jgi:hypothetical protein
MAEKRLAGATLPAVAFAAELVFVTTGRTSAIFIKGALTDSFHRVKLFSNRL